MKAWISESYSDEDGPEATEGRSVIIQGTKTEMMEIASFMASLAQQLEVTDYCHMHLRDHMPGWEKETHIDIEMNVEKDMD